MIIGANKDTHAGQLVTFPMGHDIYGIEILKIQEVINYQEIKQTSSVPDFIEGTIELRNSVIPIMDLKKRMGIEEITPGKKRIIILNLPERPLGIVVDDFSRVLLVDNSYYELLPSDVMTNQAASCIEHVVKTDDSVILIISPEKILTHREHQALESFEEKK